MYVCDRPPENNPFYSSIDIMPELRLARRKSMTLVSDLVSHDSTVIGTSFLFLAFPSQIPCFMYVSIHSSMHI